MAVHVDTEEIVLCPAFVEAGRRDEADQLIMGNAALRDHLTMIGSQPTNRAVGAIIAAVRSVLRG